MARGTCAFHMLKKLLALLGSSCFKMETSSDEHKLQTDLDLDAVSVQEALPDSTLNFFHQAWIQHLLGKMIDKYLGDLSIPRSPLL